MQPQESIAEVLDKAPTAIEQIIQILINAGDEPIVWVALIGTLALIGLKIWRKK